MEKMDAVAALSALSQENRLDVYRLLVQAGPDGLAAGDVAAKLGIAPNTLSFHLDRLRHAGLVAHPRLLYVTGGLSGPRNAARLWVTRAVHRVPAYHERSTRRTAPTGPLAAEMDEQEH